MYELNLLKTVDPPCDTMDKDGDCDVDSWEDDHEHYVLDAHSHSAKCFSPCAYLPHSCGEWVIGGPEQIKLLIADLEKVLKKMEA